jgi:enoyl-CoA hydratase/carnithine racemase
LGTISTTHSAEGIATVTISNPSRLNAMKLSMWHALAETMHSLSSNQATRVVILRGEGEAAFVSGADISEFAKVRETPAAVEAYDLAVLKAEEAISTCTKPVLAAMSGVCYGGGLGIALCCDLRYANHTARFSLPAAKLGLGYGLNNIKRMQDIIGTAQTYDFLLTARVCNSIEAVNIGMIHACEQDVFTHAIDQAKKIAMLAPLTLSSIKLAMRHLYGAEDAPDVSAVKKSVIACFESLDYAEGRKAFKEKRTPKFTGQ